MKVNCILPRTLYKLKIEKGATSMAAFTTTIQIVFFSKPKSKPFALNSGII